MCQRGIRQRLQHFLSVLQFRFALCNFRKNVEMPPSLPTQTYLGGPNGPKANSHTVINERKRKLELLRKKALAIGRVEKDVALGLERLRAAEADVASLKRPRLASRLPSSSRRSWRKRCGTEGRSSLRSWPTTGPS